MKPRQFLYPRSLAASALAMLGTAIFHQGWKNGTRGTPQHGLLDLVCHLGTACVVTLPVLPNTRHQKEFGLVAIGSAVSLDLDHIIAARSLEVNRWMTMPTRPPTHSLIGLIFLAWSVERISPGKRLWLAVLLGVGSHLLRDLATGGAPLWHPRRVITWPAPAVFLMLIALTVAGWFVAGLPIKQRAPESPQP